jgi:sugar lactone lactonase YvrE
LSHRRLIALLLLGLTGCQAPVVGPAPAGKGGAARPVVRSTPVAPVGNEGLRVLRGALRTVELVGKVKLLSDLGGGVISNNSGALISNHGASLISDNGGGLVGKGKLRLTQQTSEARPEALLAEARIELIDAAGHTLADADGKPLVTVTDAQGAFGFEVRLPAENLLARVRLRKGGELIGLVTRDASGRSELSIDTASTMGTRYVLERLAERQQARFDRLPAGEAESLRQHLERLRGKLGNQTPRYESEDLHRLTDAWRAADPTLDQRIQRIEALLLVGQTQLGEGRLATEVALSAPHAVEVLPDGSVLVAEVAGGRIRRIGLDGRITRYAGGDIKSTRQDGPQAELAMMAPNGMVRGPDGTLYVSDRLNHRVYALENGQGRVAVGTGAREAGPAGRPGPEVAIQNPSGLSLGPDGRLWIVEQPRSAGMQGRLLVLARDGRLDAVPLPAAYLGENLTGVAATADGAVWLCERNDRENHLWRRDSQGTWSVVPGAFAFADAARLLPLPDSAVLVAEDAGHRVLRVAPDGSRTVVAGDGEAGYAGDGGPAAQGRLTGPSGLALDASGALLIADLGNGLVRRVLPPLDGTGRIETFAGAHGVSQQGAALNIAINTPGGMALDGQGRLVFTESGSHVVKRLAGGRLEVVAGGQRGISPDGVPVSEVRFEVPLGVAVHGDRTYVVDLENLRICRLEPDGVVRDVVGPGRNVGPGATRMRSNEAPIGKILACAVAPDGRLYWSDADGNAIFRLLQDGMVEAVAGSFGQRGGSGDGGPAQQALLSSPLGMAFDAAGRLYFGDAGNFRIRRISGLEGPTPVIETVVGAEASLLEVAVPTNPSPTPAARTLVTGPTGIAFDEQGRMYFAEVGNTRVGTLVGNLGFSLGAGLLHPNGPRICRVSGLDGPSPMVEAVAGDGTPLMSQPGTDDALHSPMALLYEPGKGLYVLDTGNNVIRLLPREALGP